MTYSLKTNKAQIGAAVNPSIRKSSTSALVPTASRPAASACLLKPKACLDRPNALSAPPPADEPFNWEAVLPQKRLMRVQEVAQVLDCSEDHVYNLLDEGALRVAVDIRTSAARRGCARVLRDSVLEFLRHADFALR